MGFIFKAIGSYNEGEATAQSAEYNSAVARQNAEIAGQQSEAASQAQQRDAARKIGASIAAYGASGVQTDSGSPLDVLADSARMATLDNLTLKYNYALKARGFQSQASLGDAKAANARTAAVLNIINDAEDTAARVMGGGSPIPSFG
mgnify:CR=1 FL=1